MDCGDSNLRLKVDGQASEGKQEHLSSHLLAAVVQRLVTVPLDAFSNLIKLNGHI